MNINIIIVLCVLIALILLLIPLIVSRKEEKLAKDTEWNKIKNYGNAINNRTRKNK